MKVLIRWGKKGMQIRKTVCSTLGLPSTITINLFTEADVNEEVYLRLQKASELGYLTVEKI